MYSNFDPDITISHNTKKSFYDKEFNYSLLSNPEIQTYSRKEGFKGLFLRGLMTKIIGNGLQNMLFMILWKS